MSRIGEPAPIGHGFVEEPFTTCKFCSANLDPKENMMYYCDTQCYFKANQEGTSVNTQCSHKSQSICMIYDAVYCEECHVWLEPKCTDDDCDYCSKRPASYSHVIASLRATATGHEISLRSLPN
jgi:hypothetical protein